MSKRSTLFLLGLTVLLFAAYSFSVEQNAIRDAFLGASDDDSERASLGSQDVDQELLEGDSLMIAGADLAAADKALLFKSLLKGEKQSDGSIVPAQEASKRAVRLILDAAERNDKEFLAQVSEIGANCAGCKAFYGEVQTLLADKGLDTTSRYFLASALAQSGNPQLQRNIAEKYNAALQDSAGEVSPAVYGDALANATLAPEAVEQLSEGLESENEYVKEAIVSALTKQGTLEAAQKLYDLSINEKDPDGYYLDNMGLGRMKPKPEAFGYLESLVRRNDEYSHLAVKALLNGGMEGLERVVSILSETGDSANKGLMIYAVDRVNRDPATLKYLSNYVDSPNQAIRQLARGVIREYEISEERQHMEFVYSDNYLDGIVQPTGGQPRYPAP